MTERVRDEEFHDHDWEIIAWKWSGNDRLTTQWCRWCGSVSYYTYTPGHWPRNKIDKKFLWSNQGKLDEQIIFDQAEAKAESDKAF